MNNCKAMIMEKGIVGRWGVKWVKWWIGMSVMGVATGTESNGRIRRGLEQTKLGCSAEGLEGGAGGQREEWGKGRKEGKGEGGDEEEERRRGERGERDRRREGGRERRRGDSTTIGTGKKRKCMIEKRRKRKKKKGQNKSEGSKADGKENGLEEREPEGEGWMGEEGGQIRAEVENERAKGEREVKELCIKYRNINGLNMKGGDGKAIKMACKMDGVEARKKLLEETDVLILGETKTTNEHINIPRFECRIKVRKTMARKLTNMITGEEKIMKQQKACAGGVMIAVRKELSHEIEWLQTEGDGVIAFKANKWKSKAGRPLVIVGVYIPPGGNKHGKIAEETEYGNVWGNIKKIKEKHKNHSVIIMGDFNAYKEDDMGCPEEELTAEDREYVMADECKIPENRCTRKSRCTHRRNKAGEKLLEMCAEEGWSIINGLTRNGEQIADSRTTHMHINRHGKETVTTIDYCVTTKDWLDGIKGLKHGAAKL